MKRILLSAAAVLTVASIPVSARAQSHGVGFPIGEKSRVHTNLDLGVGFDSNSLRLDTEMNGNQGDWKALIRPGLFIDVPGTTLNFDLRSQLSISQFFGTGAVEAKTEFGALIGAKLRAGQRDSVVGFQLDDTLVRTPATIDDLGAVAADERRFKEWANRGQAVISLRPGGGALEFDVGYTNELSIYDGAILPDSQRHGALAEAKLRFLPKTAVLFHSDISFFDANGAQSEDGRGTLKSSPLNLTIGLVGQVTTKLTTDLEVGYGDTFTSTGDYFSGLADSRTGTVIGRAEITYDIIEASRITVGYRRQVKPVILLNSYSSDSPYLRFILGLGARLAFGLYGSYEWRDYGLENAKAQLLIGDARIDYWFFEFLTASLNYRVIRQDATGPTTNAALAALLEDYTRHEAMMFVGLRY
jgi:hypothetical protein